MKYLAYDLPAGLSAQITERCGALPGDSGYLAGNGKKAINFSLPSGIFIDPKMHPFEFVLIPDVGYSDIPSRETSYYLSGTST